MTESNTTERIVLPTGSVSETRAEYRVRQGFRFRNGAGEAYRSRYTISPT